MHNFYVKYVIKSCVLYKIRPIFLSFTPMTVVNFESSRSDTFTQKWITFEYTVLSDMLHSRTYITVIFFWGGGEDVSPLNYPINF